MKIIKKPKIPPQTCRICGCVVQVKTKDLVETDGTELNGFLCLICCARNVVKFEKEAEIKNTEDEYDTKEEGAAGV